MNRVMPRPRQSFKQLDQSGIVDAWFLAFVGALIGCIGALIFGVWAFLGMQDYKNNVQPKIDAAVAKAEEATSAKKDAEFVEKEKNPLRVYTGPAAYGSVSISYPKTWNVYADESDKGSNPLDAYFNPGFVPGLRSDTNVALRVQILDSAYADSIKTFESQIKSGKITATPYKIAKVPTVIGLRFDGEIVTKKQGSMIILPLRDKTLKIWTEATQFVPDFDTTILPNLSLIP